MMEQMIIKNLEHWENGKIKSRQKAKLLSGDQKGTEIIISTFNCDKEAYYNNLIGNKFFGTIKKINGTNYLISYII